MTPEGSWRERCSPQRAAQTALMGLVALYAVLFVAVAVRRHFNFDEFQVLYASAAILRGKAYYADGIGSHFPLSNILVGALLELTGFKAFSLLAGRCLMVLANAITCLYVYKIASRMWNRRAGLLAVAILLSTAAFLDKGIEIRHDVFNTLFNVTAAYCGIRYLAEKRRVHLVLCGLLLGMAIASTQKAVVWSFGIALGLTASLLREGAYKEAGKMLLAFVWLVPLPLALSLLCLFAVSDEGLSSFLQGAVVQMVPFLNPTAKDLFPFPHDRIQLLKELVKPNPLIYAAGIVGLGFLAVKRTSLPRGRTVLLLWCGLGLLFYLTLRRPFFQSLLPTLPPLAVVASGFLTEAKGVLKPLRPLAKISIYSLILFFLFLWPLQFAVPKISESRLIERQLYNTAFCLANLKSGEKVLCFSQNQVFFDPVLPLDSSVCGERFYEYDPTCFERQMIRAQCRVIIDDYRTRLLNPEIRRSIASHYLALKRGQILIPGFILKPGEVTEKRVWIDGTYYSPTLSLEVDGQRIHENAFRLVSGDHTFANPTDRTVSLVLLFKPASWAKPTSAPGSP